MSMQVEKPKQMQTQELKKLLQDLEVMNQVLHSGQKKIMVIDDCPVTLRCLIKYINGIEGYRGIGHTDEFLAIKIFKDEMPDMLIIDVNLKNTTGVALSKILSYITLFKVPVIYISSDNSYQFHSTINKDNSFISKPIRPSQLKKVIGQALSK